MAGVCKVNDVVIRNTFFFSSVSALLLRTRFYNKQYLYRIELLFCGLLCRRDIDHSVLLIEGNIL